MKKAASGLMGLIIVSTLCGCVSTPSALDWLAEPTAEMIQTKTEPRYGELTQELNPGDMAPVSTKPAEEKGLARGGKLNSKYAIVQNMYRAILLPWLVDTLGLAPFDAQIAEQGITETVDDGAPFSLYAQRCAGVELKYIYIRNNIYIERLSQEQIDTFLSHANDSEFTVNPELSKIVQETYPQVIRLEDTDANIRAGFDLSGRSFPNDAVVVDIAVGAGPDDLDAQGHYTELHRQRIIFLQDTIVPNLTQAIEQNWPGNTSLLYP